MNPNEVPAAKTRATRWLVWSGVISLLLAILCMASSFMLTLWGMVSTFNTRSNPPTKPVSSEVVRHYMGLAEIPLYAVVPLGLLGILLLILGFVLRRPVIEQGEQGLER
jgi:NADH:ubiquinone oxidoreductase subunit 5 (subunit L)/multisubunit Na+/H+ antiporter MnhA subunit